MAAVTVLPKRAQKLVGSVEVAEPDERLDRVRYGLDHLQAAPGLRARYVLERSPRLCGVVQRKLQGADPQRFIAAGAAMDRVRAGNALGSEVAGFLDAAAQGRKRCSSLHELGLGPAIDAHAGVGVLLGVLDVPLRELPAACVPLDVGEIPRQPVTVGRCALLKEARQLRLERVASAIQVAEAQKSATGELADRGEPDRNAVFICERRRTRDDVRLRTTCEVGAVGDDQEQRRPASRRRLPRSP